MIALMQCLEVFSEADEPVSRVIAPIDTRFRSGEINATVRDARAKMADVERAYAGAKIDRLDGVTISYPDWWMNVRLRTPNRCCGSTSKATRARSWSASATARSRSSGRRNDGAPDLSRVDAGAMRRYEATRNDVVARMLALEERGRRARRRGSSRGSAAARARQVRARRRRRVLDGKSFFCSMPCSGASVTKRRRPAGGSPSLSGGHQPVHRNDHRNRLRRRGDRTAVYESDAPSESRWTRSIAHRRRRGTRARSTTPSRTSATHRLASSSKPALLFSSAASRSPIRRA